MYVMNLDALRVSASFGESTMNPGRERGRDCAQGLLHMSLVTRFQIFCRADGVNFFLGQTQAERNSSRPDWKWHSQAWRCE